jgi:hypothetical protein
MSNYIIDIILSLIIKVAVEFVNGLIDKFTQLLNNLFVLTSMIVQGDFVSKITSYNLKLGIAILIFLSISQIIKLYILPEGEEPENDIMGFLVRLGKSAILISFSTEICTMIIKFTTYVSNDLLKIVSGKVTMAAMLKKETTSVSGLSFGVAIVSILLILVVIVCLFIICMQAGLRGVNLAILQMLAPLSASNYITTDKGLWNKWLQNMLAVSLTYVFQITLTNIALKFFVNGFTNILSVLVGICWLVVTIQTPKFLKEISYSTGVGNGVSKATSTAYQFIRFLK